MNLWKAPVRFASQIARSLIAISLITASFLTASTSPALCQQNTQNANGEADSQKQSPSTTGSTDSNQSAPSRDNPFPESQSQAAAKADSNANDADKSNDAPSGSSSSAGGYSSSDAQVPVADVGQGSSGSKSKPDSFTRDQTQDGRIESDLKIADLYMRDGNYRGALLRYQDALQLDAQNDTVQYGVAYAMCKQNLTTEAMARFKNYVKNNPQGEYAIKAEKLLAHPDKCMHNW